MSRWFVVQMMAIVSGWMLLAVVPADAANPKAFNLHDAGKKICDEIKLVVADPQPIFVRAFHSPASEHVGLAKIVGDELTTLGYPIKSGAKIELAGRLVRLPINDDEPILGFTIRCELLLVDGTERKFELDVLNTDQAHVAVTGTGETIPSPNAAEGAEPEVKPTIVNSQVLPAPESPYRVEILVEQASGGHSPVKPFADDPLLKVKLAKDAIYAVKVYNDTDYEAVASVYIDGMSRYAMANDPKMQDGLDLVPAHGSRIIKGYYRDGKTVDSFQVGEYSESAAAKRLPTPVDIGLIKVTFAACWKKGEDPPPNEPHKSRSVLPQGTRFGPARKDPTQVVERDVGKIRSVVEIRYDQPE